MPENGVTSSVPEVPACRSLEMASSSRSFVVEVGKMGCCDGQKQAERGSVSCKMDGCDPVQAENAEGSQGDSIPLPNLTCHGSNGNECCSTCGVEKEDMHRMKKDGVLCLYCSSCVLFHQKGMYCCQCLRVCPGDSALSLICSKCQRFCHMDCAQNQGLSTNSFFFACQYCYREPPTGNQTGNPTFKRSRMDISLQESSSLSDQETLAAAQIVAYIAAKEAKEAKDRARACAAIAARAVKLAKAALDVAYRAGQEEVRWRLEAPKHTLVAAPIDQTLKKMQTGAYIGNARTQQTISGLDDLTRLKVFAASHQGIVVKNFGNSSCNLNGSQAAAANLSHHQRRVLPPVVSPDVTGPPFMSSQSVRKLPQHHSFKRKESQPLCGFVGSGQNGSLSSLPKEQRFVNGFEGLIVDAPPESILEGSTLSGAPKSDAAAHPGTPGLAGNLLHDTERVEIISNEETVDDFVYVGDLLAESFQKE